MYELMGRVHARAMQERGQGTVEYVGLIMLIAAVLAVVLTGTGALKSGDIADAVVKQIKVAIGKVGEI
jgi:hypothetical protein